MVEEQAMKNEGEKEQGLKNSTIHQTNENCQVFNGPISGCVFAMPGATVNQSPMQQVNGTARGVKNEENTIKAPRSKGNKDEKPPKPRETMTFKRRGQVTDGHLTLIFMKLLEEKWIDGNEADFKALFAGVPDEDCILTWKGTFGKSTLVELFRQMVGSGLVVVPDGFTVPGILEGHFKDESGAWLTGLGKGDKPAVKALPQIARCVKVLKATPQSLMSGGLDDDDDFVTEYDPYDHQDLQYHH